MTKRLLTLAGASLALLLAVTGCNQKDKPQLLDPMAKVTINVEESAPRAEMSNNPKHYSPQELVEKSFAMLYIQPGTPEKGGINDTRDSQLSLPPEYKDIPNAKIKLFGEWIIARKPDGTTYLSDHFFTATECRFVEDTDGTTTGFKIIGYLPREVMEEAWRNIKSAYDAGDYDTVYKLFEEAMVAYPCTPEEYAELKAQGKV